VAGETPDLVFSRIWIRFRPYIPYSEDAEPSCMGAGFPMRMGILAAPAWWAGAAEALRAEGSKLGCVL